MLPECRLRGEQHSVMPLEPTKSRALGEDAEPVMPVEDQQPEAAYPRLRLKAL